MSTPLQGSSRRIAGRQVRAALFLVALTGPALAQVADSPPTKKAAEVPPYKWKLGAEDAKRVAALKEKVSELRRAGRFTEAQDAARTILEVRQRRQGLDHWATEDARRELRTLAYISGLPANARAELAEDAKLFAEVTRLNQRGRYADAVPLLRRALAIRRRHLGEDGLEVAKAMNDLGFFLRMSGKPTEAQPLLEHALVLCRKVVGDDHPNTAHCYTTLAGNLKAQGRCAAAQPLFEKALAIRRHVLGDDDPLTALSYNNLAVNLSAQGRFAEAQPLFEKALTIYRRVRGDEHLSTATGYLGVAGNLRAQGQYAAAQPLFEKALAITHKVVGDDHPQTAESYSTLAGNLEAQGRYAAAQPLFEKALAIRRHVLGEAHPLTAASYNNLAGNLQRQGREAEAQPLFERALATCRRMHSDNHPETAGYYNNLAYNLYTQGRYADAQPLYDKALAILRHLPGENYAHTATSYNNLALNRSAQGRYAEAHSLYEKALAIYCQTLGEGHPETAHAYNNMAGNLKHQGRCAEAQPLYEKALAICRQALGEGHPRTATSYNNLALNLHAQGRYAEAEVRWTQAAGAFEIARLRSQDTGLGRASFTGGRPSPFPFLAASLARTGKPTEAWRRLEHGLARGLLDDLTTPSSAALPQDERERQQALAAQLNQLDKQILPLASTGKKREAGGTQLQELLKQRQAVGAELTRLVVARSTREIFPLARIQQHLPADGALVAWADVPGQPKAPDPNGEHWACVVRHQGPPVWVKLAGSGSKGTWTEDDEDLPRQCQLALSTPAGENPGDRPKLMARLAAQRLAPLAAALRGDAHTPPVKHLLIEPAWGMAGVPIEALTEDRYTISYVPSGTLFARLREKPRPAAVQPSGSPRLLAVGDPVFTRPEPPQTPEAVLPANGLLIARVTPKANAAESGIQPGDVLLKYGGFTLTNLDDLKIALAKQSPAKPGEELRIPVEVWRDGKTLPLHVRSGPLGIQTSSRPAKEELLARREGDRILRSSHGKDWPALPGTQREVQAIARLFDQPVTLLGSEASEQRLDALAASAELKGFRYLHFATHGEVNDRIALESALILAQDHLPDPVDQMLAGKYPYDGRLTAAEMRRWQLDAELVTLSACETGLGQRLGGEGYLGFAQALFLAGTRSVVLSLWKVDDTATALLMTRFYQNLLGKRKGLDRPMARAEALQEAKRWLRGLTADQAAHEAADLPAGVRGRPAAIPTPPKGAAIPHPFADPYYWSAFILIGDPD